MNMTMAVRLPEGASAQVYLDPLDEDSPFDEEVVTTRRAISRVALVATEVGSRFQREGVAHDPMTWMLSPRTLFAGASAIEACLDRDACLRGVLLHGLSLGLDADPAAVDALSNDAADDDDHLDTIDWKGLDGASDGVGPPPRGEPRDAGRLFTAVMSTSDGIETVQAFHASLACDEAEIANRLHVRMGAAMADAVIVDGFDATMPLVDVLVAPALRDTLSLVAADPNSPLAAGLDLHIEQRFLN